MMRLRSGVLTIGAWAWRQRPYHSGVDRAIHAAIRDDQPGCVRIRLTDITVTRWSGERRAPRRRGPSRRRAHRLPRPPVQLLPGGTLSVIGGRTFTLRYAWQALDRDGTRHVFLATDQAISLAATTSPVAEALTFLELRLDPGGNGEGKLSEAQRLTVDQARNLIVLREYDNRPVHLIEVRALQTEKQRPAE